MKSPESKPDTSLNARVGAFACLVGAIGLGILALLPVVLAPLTLLSTGIATFGIWAFCDEMGMKKPLIRAGFVAFVFAVAAKSLALLNFSSPDITRYYLFYAFALLIALLLWSAAFLHRQRDLKIVGAIGAFTTVTPIALLIIGHIIVGAGAIFGINSLYVIANELPQSKFAAIDNVDLIFAVWGSVAGALLWTGRIRTSD